MKLIFAGRNKKNYKQANSGHKFQTYSLGELVHHDIRWERQKKGVIEVTLSELKQYLKS